MDNKYREWIDNYKGETYRKCVEVSQEMKGVFPKLNITKGMVSILEDGKEYPHQWLVDENGKIVDPTAGQWLGITEYKEIKETDPQPIGKCYNCGGWVYGKFINGLYCSPDCSVKGSVDFM